MNDDFDRILRWVIVLGIIVFVIYLIEIMIGVLISIAGISGIVWGGGTAIVNYGKSFKENIIDSNRTAV